MHAKIKGTALISHNAQLRALLFACMLATALFAPAFNGHSQAQDAQTTPQQSSRPKPQLVEIKLDETNYDQSAKNIVKAMVNDASVTELTDSDFNARFIPIQSKESNERFIFAIFENPEFGGCYARGCMTVIYKGNSENQWQSVFSAYVIRSFYDQTSNIDKPANLIFSSNVDNSNPGVWMWNGKQYVIVNKQ